HTRSDRDWSSDVCSSDLQQITEELLRVRDPQNNVAAITRVDRASQVYQGPYANQGPDLLVGYNRGYRAGWQTILGNFPTEVFEEIGRASCRERVERAVGA